MILQALEYETGKMQLLHGDNKVNFFVPDSLLILQSLYY